MSVVALTAAYEPCTVFPEFFDEDTSFGSICLIDTPGLGEDDVGDEAHVRAMSLGVDLKVVDRLLHVSPLTETRLRPDEKRTLRSLTVWTGAPLWQEPWLVLIFAANVPSENLDERIVHRRQQIASCLQDLLPNGSFRGFPRAFVIDNVVPNWCPGAPPVTSRLCHTNKH